MKIQIRKKMGAKQSVPANRAPPPSVEIKKPENNVYKAQAVSVLQPTRLRILIVAISYKGTPYELHGTIPDGQLMLDTLQKRNFAEKNKEVVVMNDLLPKDDPKFPTDTNIMRALDWLLSSYEAAEFENKENISFSDRPMKSGTVAAFYYSGHGMQVADTNSDEADGMDEVICSLNPDGSLSYDGITDDRLSQIFNARCRKDCYIVNMTDCCHSGTILDLKYTLRNNGAFSNDRKYKDSTGNIIHVGACYDKQSAYEGYVSSGRLTHGFMTYCFSEIFANNKNKNRTLFEFDRMLKEKMLHHVNKTYQLPVISTGNQVSAYKAIFPL